LIEQLLKNLMDEMGDKQKMLLNML